MKKIYILTFILLLVLLIVVSCTNHEDNIIDKSSSFDVKQLNFIQMNAAIVINENPNSPYNRSLDFYGTLENSVDQEILNNQISSVYVTIKGEKIYAQEYKFLINKDEKEQTNFTLNVKFNPSNFNSKGIIISTIGITSNEKEYDFNVGNYEINFTQLTEKDMYIYESPHAPHTLPKVGDINQYSYIIVSTREKDITDINLITSEISQEFITIHKFECINTEEYLLDLKDSFKDILPTDKFENLKFYELVVSYSINKASNFSFQPLLKVTSDAIIDFCTPEIPLTFEYIER